MGGFSFANCLPPSLALGSFELGALTLQPTLNIQFDGFREVNAGWGGDYSPPIEESKQFYEQSNEQGLNSTLNLQRYGPMLVRVSGIFAATGGGLNPAGTNYGEIQNDNYSLEDAYLKWTSGNLFPALGQDAVQIIGDDIPIKSVTDFSFTMEPKAEVIGRFLGRLRITHSLRAESSAWILMVYSSAAFT